MTSEARRVIAIFVTLVTGFWGLVITSSDSPASSSMATLIAYIAAWHIPGALVVGYLYPKKWRLGLLGCWGAVLMTGSPVVSIAVLLAAGVAAYLGRLLANRVAVRRPRSQAGPRAN